MTYNHDLPPEPQFPTTPPADVEQLAATLRDAFLDSTQLTVWDEATPEVRTRWCRVAEAALDRAAPTPAPAREAVTVEDVVDGIAGCFSKVSDLPEWMQNPALGQDMRRLQLLAARAVLTAFDVRRKP